MYSLRSIEIDEDIRCDEEKTLLEISKFPNLKYLTFLYTGLKKEIDWSLCDRSLFQNLHGLHLRGINHPKFLFIDQEKFKNLKVLNLEFDRILTNEVRSLYHEKEIHLNLPNLRVLSLENVSQLLKKFHIKPNGKLLVFRCYKCWDLEPYVKLVSESPKLQCLEVGSSRGEVDGFSFLDPFIVTHAYPDLKKLKIERQFKLSETNYEFFESLCYQELEELDISLHSYNKTDVFSDQECPNLKKLSIDFSQSYGTINPSYIFIERLNWPCSTHLTYLSVSGYTAKLSTLSSSSNNNNNQKWYDQLFIKNEFPSLQFLRIYLSNNFTGKGWVSKFPSLKELELLHLPNFTDDFFKEHDELHHLERLRIYDLDKFNLQGIGWSHCFMNIIKELSFGRCTIMKSFFDNDDVDDDKFLKLEKMYLESFKLGIEKFVKSDGFSMGLFSSSHNKGREISIGNRILYFSDNRRKKDLIQKMKEKISDWDRFIFE